VSSVLDLGFEAAHWYTLTGPPRTAGVPGSTAPSGDLWV